METRQMMKYQQKSKTGLLLGKISVTQAVRHLFQIAGFLLMPGLFILALGSFKGLWQAMLGGQFTWAAMGAPLLTLLAVIPVTALWGRFFCGYLCAFGGMQELLAFIAKKLHIKQLKIRPEADRVMRNIKYGVLAALFALWTFSISYEFISPWSVFGQYSNYKGWSNLSGWFSVGGQLLIAVIISSLFIERGFCRYFCPLGGVFSLISKGRLFRVKGSGKCVSCGGCDSECPMGVNVSKEAGGAIPGGSVQSSECIDCFRCVEKCGRKALYTSPREAVAGSAAALAIAGVYQIGAITVGSPVASISSLTAASQGKYVDGVYEGSAQGYRGEIKVKVKVSGGQIASIDVESYSDDEQFFSRAKNTVIAEIISGQTTDVSTVSGATYSSRGIMQAVANALGITTQQSGDFETLPDEHGGKHGFGGSQDGGSQDGGRRKKRPGGGKNGGSGSDKKSDRKQDGGSEQSPDKNAAQDNASQNAGLDFSNLKDGTYSGSGQGRNGSIEVSVKVKGGKVTSITIESSREDAQYMNKAKDTVVSEIIDAQSLNVKTVSGATMSSNGILSAVADALGIEYTNQNSSMRGGRRH
jgi:Polyferredoxin